MRTGAIAGCLAVMTLFGLLTRTAPFATRNIPEARGLQTGCFFVIRFLTEAFVTLIPW